ncbi:Hypothetical protein NCS54_00225400 [Fusarium falciforme]|uniref:Hypothetical protein n=1 Tax=Fusarium falciforme TaxID=195108 RepID=UPI002301FC40|nr:Hypothetical protein NCS54_00225400 [Fusarium falciforme]WAO85021.1 Hypothetical protein NCS54_00225400 [Fusarium falciforme]
MPVLDTQGTAHPSPPLDGSFDFYAGPNLLDFVEFSDDKQWVMKDAKDRLKVLAALCEVYLHVTTVQPADFAGLPSESLLTLNELMNDIVHDVHELGKSNNLAALDLIEMSRSHASDEFKELVEDKIRDLEIQRDVIKGKVDMIHGLREFQLDEEEEFEVVAEPVAVPRVPKGDYEWTQAIINNKGPMIILNNLPTRITYAQVMEGVTGLGGISSVLVKPEPAGSRKGAYCAALHFNNNKAANAYIDFFKEKPLFFVDQEGDVHKARMLHFQTAAPSDHDPQSSVSGRCLDFNNFPATAVWAAIKKIGISHIVRVTFNPDASSDVGELSVEMTDAVRASYVRDMSLGELPIPGFSGRAEDISDGLCESDYPPSHIQNRYANVIPYVAQNHLDKWNQAPYNTWEPPRPLQPESYVRMIYQATLPRIPEEEVRLRPEMTLGSRTYTCEDGCVYKLSTGYPSSQIEVRGQELKVLQALTLGKNEWADFWRELALQQQVLNPDTYAHMVEHRRLMAEGQITCPTDCYECGPSLQDSPTPLRAQMYTQTSDEGFMHGAWLHGDDVQIRLSIPPMTPQMGQILRYE